MSERNFVDCVMDPLQNEFNLFYPCMQVMTATGRSLSYTAQQRLALRAPLVRLFQEVDTFQTRAIEDTGKNVFIISSRAGRHASLLHMNHRIVK